MKGTPHFSVTLQYSPCLCHQSHRWWLSVAKPQPGWALMEIWGFSEFEGNFSNPFTEEASL